MTQPAQAQTPFAPCPDKPNCVSSLETTPRHQIAPLTYSGQAPDWGKLLPALASLGKFQVKSQDETHLELVFFSAWWGFEDEVSLWADQPGQIQVRSASKKGHWDLGVNRKRVEALRKLLQDLDKPQP